MQRDHGYNPPPPWGVLGSRLANLGPAGDFQIRALASIDFALIALMWAGVGWAFGWRALCVAVIYWGTNLFGVFGWNGGGFLRQMWLVSAIGGLCCLRRNHSAAAGALLTVSALLRIFPGVILVAVGIRAGWGMVRERRIALAPEHRRLLVGCLAAAGVIVPLSLLTYGGVRPWIEFVDNSRTDLGTPAFLAFAVRDQPDWVAGVLGIGLIPIAFELTNYYYAILLGYGLLCVRWKLAGAALCGVAALSWAIVERWQWQDEILTWCSGLVVLFVVFSTALVFRHGRVPERPS
jgi:hypothetical protein